MRDFIRDWKKWGHAERMLAVVLALLMIVLPVGLLISGTAGV
jgi:hypothetical protein